MPRQSGQKKKLLAILKILTEESDENHPVSRAMLERKLAAQGIQAERKSIYDDISELVLFGYDIVQKRDEPKGYYMASRDFELAELKLLVDAVASSRFMSEKKSSALIQKIEHLASCHEAGALQRHVVVKQRAKTENETVFYSVDAIHEAISRNWQVSFVYTAWNTKKELVPKKQGKRYHVSPYELIWDSENYYLLAYDAEAGMMKHYRVDKMKDTEMLEKPRAGREEYEKINLAEYAKSVFSMFRGKEETVQACFASHLAGAVIDRFGKDVPLLPRDEEHFAARLKVELSPQFFAWISSFGKDAWIEKPEAAAAACREFLQEALRNYQTEDRG